MNRRRGGLTDDEIKLLSKEIALELSSHNVCSFTPEEQTSLKSLLKTKKWAAMTFMAGVGTILLWMLKDLYDWARHMVHWGNQ